MKQEKLNREPLVSAVIPAYNAESYIEETIQSLLQQTSPLTEIIIVDDCSNDNTVKIVSCLKKQYKGLVRLYQQKINSGASTARNVGVNLANTEWVLFMDADDVAEPDLIKMELEQIRKLINLWQEEVVLAYPACSIISASGESIPGIHQSKQVGHEEILGYQFVRNQIITTSGTLVKKQIFQRVNGFDESIRYSEDWDLWLRMAAQGGFAYIDQPLVRVRRHFTNISKKLDNMLGGEQQILRKYSFDFIQSAIDKRKLAWEENRADFVSVIFRIGCWAEGFEIAGSIVANKPDYPKSLFLIGLYYLSQKDWINAKEAFEKVLQIEPNNGAALNNLGAILVLLDKIEDAKGLLLKALSLFPNFLDASENLSILEDDNRNLDNLRFTWRELRPVLTVYTH